MSTYKVTISSLLKRERERLGFTQAQVAQICGVSREVWGRYEKAKTMPGADVIFLFVRAGASPINLFKLPDASDENLSSHEGGADLQLNEIINIYNSLNQDAKNIILNLLKLLNS